MAKSTQYIVSKRPDGWAVIKAGAERAIKIFPTQKDAQNYASELANKNDGFVNVQNKEGKFRKK
jgi:hypothetical protein